MGDSILVHRWASGGLPISAFRMTGIGADWNALVVEGNFLPVSELGETDYSEPVHPFVGDALWGVSESRGALLCFETPSQAHPVRSREDLANKIELAVREPDGRFSAWVNGAIEMVAFDDDVNWLVLLMPDALQASVELILEAAASRLEMRVRWSET